MADAKARNVSNEVVHDGRFPLEFRAKRRRFRVVRQPHNKAPLRPFHIPARRLPGACIGGIPGASRGMAADVTFAAALFAGLLSFLSPCVLPLVPPYLVYLAGASLERFADAEAEPRVRRETVLAALLFVVGFSTVFVALGASASVIGALVQRYSDKLAIAAGVVIIVMGLHFLGLTRMSVLMREK